MRKRNETDLDLSRYEDYKNNIKCSIEEKFPDADVCIVDSTDEDSSLDIDYGGQQSSMTVYDQIMKTIRAIHY